MTKGVVLYHATAPATGTSPAVPAEYALCVPGLAPIRTPSETVATVWVIQHHGPQGSAVNYGTNVTAYEAQVSSFLTAA